MDTEVYLFPFNSKIIGHNNKELLVFLADSARHESVFQTLTTEFFNDLTIDFQDSEMLDNLIDSLNDYDTIKYIEYLHIYIYKVFSYLAKNYNARIFTIAFRLLVKAERNRFNYIKDKCKNADTQSLKDYYSQYECNLDLPAINEVCAKFNSQKIINITNAYNNVMTIDDGFIDDKYPINIIMLLHNGEYYGHIYTWLIRTNRTNVVFFIGIRSRVDNLFLLKCNLSIHYISSYLLEGVRRFALINNATWLMVFAPLGIMP